MFKLNDALVLGHPENFCPRCARAKICQDDLGLQETIYRPREELYITARLRLGRKLNNNLGPKEIIYRPRVVLYINNEIMNEMKINVK